MIVMKQFREIIFAVLLIASFANLVRGIPKEALLTDHYVVGRLAELEDFPFLASLRIKSIHYCAATIIDKKWAITAAQCYQNVPITDYTIVSSTQQLNFGSGIEHNIVNITISPDGNVALIQIEDNFKETAAILAKNYLGNFEMGIIVGWGFTAHPGTTPKDLRMIYLRILEDFGCQVAYNDYHADGSLICTMPKGKTRGICTGDVGAPLTANGKIYGVATWRQNCMDGKPEVFFSLSYRYKWITQVIYET